MVEETRASSYTRILTTTSMVLGLLNLLSSSLKLKEIQKTLDENNKVPSLPENDAYSTAASKHRRYQAALVLGVVASCLQIIFSTLVLVATKVKWSTHPKLGIWMGVHFVVFLPCVISSGLQLDYTSEGNHKSLLLLLDISLLYNILVVNWIFCLVAPVVLYNVAGTSDKETIE